MARGNYSSTGDFKGKKGPNAADGQATRSDKAGKAFSELSPAEQKKKASSALQIAQTKAFAAPKGSPEAAKHFKARDAASRVVGRLSKPRQADKGPPREGSEETRAARGKRRRKPIADRTTKRTQSGLDAVAKAARQNG